MNNKELVENIKEGFNDLNVIVQQLTADTIKDRKLISIYILKEMMTQHYMQGYIETATEELARELDKMKGDF